MKRHNHNSFLAALTAISMAVSGVILPVEQLTPVFSLEAYAEGITGSVNTDRLNVRSGPGTSYGKVATLGAGTQVSINGETAGSDGYTWYAISFQGGSGYARYDLISRNVTYSAAGEDFEAWMSNQGFPESYKNGLRGLHAQYPNWVFTAQHTGLDWETVIAEESRIGRNLVADNSISSWKSIGDGAFDWANNYWPGFDGASWVQASTDLIRYYMDPRNFLTDPYIFQFERQTYNPAIQTREGLVNLVQGTFLSGDAVVPVDGSQIEGGTIIEGSVWQSGAQSYSSGQPAGPGTGSETSGNYLIIGPGGNSSISGNDSSAGPGTGSTDYNSGFNADNVVVIGAVTGLADMLLGTLTAFAGRWKWMDQPDIHWVYLNDDGSLLKDGWFWLDANLDGTAECYYFDGEGRMAADTYIDGYYVDAEGKWAETDGHVHTKQVSIPEDTSPAVQTQTESEQTVSGQTDNMPMQIDVSSVNGNDASGYPQTQQNVAGQMKKVPYVDIIMKAAQVSGVSPYVLASSILQEQGKGTSDLISGNHSQYPGYYNYYNTGAYAHDGMSAVEAGLKYASESGNGGRPWNTIEKAIIGGASAYGASYVNNGQDTFYLKKFNVQGSNKYNHQFMTHVLAAASEGAKVSNAYSAGVKGGGLEFKIPVYTGMPDSPAGLPAGDGNPNNKLSFLGVDGYALTPTFHMDNTEYQLIVDGSAAAVNINAQAIDAHASVSGAGGISLNVGANEVYITVRAQNGSERNYHISITRREYYGDQAGTYTGGPFGGIVTDSAVVTDNNAQFVNAGTQQIQEQFNDQPLPGAENPGPGTQLPAADTGAQQTAADQSMVLPAVDSGTEQNMLPPAEPVLIPGTEQPAGNTGAAEGGNISEGVIIGVGPQ